MNRQMAQLIDEMDGITPLDLRVLLRLGLMADRHGVAATTALSLAELLHSDRANITNSLLKLRNKGYVKMLGPGRYKTAEWLFIPMGPPKRLRAQ